MNKILIVDYSWSGHTATLAQTISDMVASDRYQIQVQPSTFAKDMYATSDIAQQQLQSGNLPTLVQPLPDCNNYDVILVGGTVWSGKPATPIMSFLSTVDTGNALLAPFYTHAGTAGEYEATFKQFAGTRPVATGLGITGNAVDAANPKIKSWLEQLLKEEK